MDRIAPLPTQRAGGQRPPGDEAALRAVSRNLESTFLAEMLKGAGFGSARQSFGGGIGEELFASQLADAYAESLVERGGIGLAESIYRSLGGKTDV